MPFQVAFMNLHGFLDFHYGEDGAEDLANRLRAGSNPEERSEDFGETALHVAVRRRRLDAVQILLDHGADMDALDRHGKSGYAHALRRGFTEVSDCLKERGACSDLNLPDQLAVAMSRGQLDRARQLLADNKTIVKTGNPEEDRLLSDMAGRNSSEAVELLIQAGADLAATGMDGGTALHMAAWFAQPVNARLLIEAGAPLEVFDRTHASSPLGWAVHGSRYSGGAEEAQDAYVEIVGLMLSRKAHLHYPGDEGGDAYWNRLLKDATPRVAAVLHEDRRR